VGRWTSRAAYDADEARYATPLRAAGYGVSIETFGRMAVFADQDDVSPLST
jgi:hypothetical protein